MGARSKAGQSVNGRAIFCLTDHSSASRVCQIRTGGRRVFINCDGKHGAVRFAVRFAVQSPESDRAAHIHRKRETSQIGLPIAQRQRPSPPRASHEVFRLASRPTDDFCSPCSVSLGCMTPPRRCSLVTVNNHRHALIKFSSHPHETAHATE
jgi:hypothetical protein